MEIGEISKKLKQIKKEMIGLLPEYLQNKIDENSYICGGCIYSLRNDAEPSDYDFFLRNKQIADELMNFFKSLKLKQLKIISKGEYKGLNLIISKYAITLGKFQIITKYVGEPIEVVGEFDFKHNMFYYDHDKVRNLVEWNFLDTNKVYFNENRARDICGTILRIAKFSKRGMIVPKKEVAKMLHRLEQNGFDESEKEIIKNYTTY